MAGHKVEMPEEAAAVHFALADPGDLPEIVRHRHRAEAAEWMALFQLFRTSLNSRRATRADSSPAGAGGSDEPTFVWHQDGLRAQAAEVACATWCVVAPATALATKYRLRAAVQLFEYLPLLAEAFLAGVLSAQLIRQIVDRTYEVNPQLLGKLDALLAEKLVRAISSGTRFSANAITSAVDGMIMSIDPDGVRTARQRAEAETGVSLTGRTGGGSCLTALLPGAAGLAVYAVIDALGRRLHDRSPTNAEGVRLTLNYCRAVALIVLVAGRGGLAAAGLTEQAHHLVEEELDAGKPHHPDASNDSNDSNNSSDADAAVDSGGVGGVGGSVEVTVTVHATQGALENPSDEIPVWIAKLGLVPSGALTRLLASARRCELRPGPADQLRPDDPLSWLTSPITPGVVPPPEGSSRMNRAERRALAGALRDRIPAYALRYRIPEWLTMRIRARDGHCRFPGCGVPAADCDTDHLEPFLHDDPISGGWTIELNLGCLCRRHHRVKTHERWVITTDANAVFTFTAPDGSTAVTLPSGPAARLDLADAGHPHAPPDTGPQLHRTFRRPAGSTRQGFGWWSGRGPDHRRGVPRRNAPAPVDDEFWSLAILAQAEAGGWCQDVVPFDEDRERQRIREDKALSPHQSLPEEELIA